MTTAYLQKLRSFSRDVRLYLSTAALFGFTYSGVYTVLLNLYILRLGYGPELIGLVNASAYLTFALFSLPAGILGTRWGTRRMMIAGTSLLAAGFGLLPLAEFLPVTWQPTWLPATFALAGLGAALYITNSSPFLMSATGADERAHAFSMQMALGPLTGFAGGLAGGLLPGLLAQIWAIPLTQPEPYRYSLLTAALVLILAPLALWRMREVGVERTRERMAQRNAGPYGLIVLMVLVGVLRVAGEGGVRSFFNAYLDAELHVPTAQIGTLMAVGSLLAVPAALTTPLLTARWGHGPVIALGALGVALSLLPLGLIPHLGAAAPSFMVMNALASIVRPAFTIYSQELVTRTWRPVMSGATNLAAGLGSGVMMLAGGHMVAQLGYRSFFLIPVGIISAGALLFWGYFRVPRGELAARAAVGAGE